MSPPRLTNMQVKCFFETAVSNTLRAMYNDAVLYQSNMFIVHNTRLALSFYFSVGICLF